MIKRLFSFFLGSLAGVTVDLGMFQALSASGLSPACSNLVSAGLATVTTYFLVARYTFDTTRSARSFIAFALWYAGSIAFFSWAIDVGASRTHWPPLFCKLVSLPFSFAVNYIFSRFLLGRTNK